MSTQNQRAIDKAYSLLRDGEEIHYLVYFGSHLYGTSDENSDLDLKGLFQPSREDLLLMNTRKSINWKSGDNTDKNSKDDIDVELWSIHYFFDLIKVGDTGAIDLLYSPSNTNCVVYQTNDLLPIFENPLMFLDPIHTSTFINYALNQAKQYACRGTRLGVLKQIYDYLEDLNPEPFMFDSRLREIAPDVLNKFYDDSYCFYKEINGDDAIVLCGKVHIYSIKLKEFYNRIKREYEKYGDRVYKAFRNEGIDWKSISHAIRCVCQLRELLTHGKIKFPLKDAPFIYKVKNGLYDWKVCEEYIVSGLDEVKKLQEETHVNGMYDVEFARNIILSLYELK